MSKNLIIITNPGLIQLTRIVISCRPLMDTILVPNENYFVITAKTGKDIDFGNFKKDLPLNSLVYDIFFDKLLKFAISLDKDCIDEEVIWKFFGGKDHVESILGQISLLNLEKTAKRFAKMILFAHILIPVEITSVNPVITAKYENGDVKVDLANLVSLIKNGRIKTGQECLVHYSSIVADKFSYNMKKNLLDGQKKIPEFIEACEYTTSIDYAKFWNLCEWTRNVVEERRLML